MEKHDGETQWVGQMIPCQYQDSVPPSNGAGAECERWKAAFHSPDTGWLLPQDSQPQGTEERSGHFSPSAVGRSLLLGQDTGQNKRTEVKQQREEEGGEEGDDNPWLLGSGCLLDGRGHDQTTPSLLASVPVL